MSDLLTLNEVREQLQLSTIQEVQKLIDGGFLQTVGTGITVRIKPESVAEYLAKNDHHEIDVEATERKPVTVVKKLDKIPIPMLPISEELSEDGKAKKQAFVDRRLLAIFEQEVYEAEIARDEALKKREKPAELEKREKAIRTLEADLESKSKSVKDKELQQAKRTTDLDMREKGLDARQSELEAECQTKRNEVEQYCQSKKAEADKLVEAQKEAGVKLLSDKKFEYENLLIQITNSEDTAKRLEERVAQAELKLRDIRNQVESYTHITAVHRDQHYRQARRSNGTVQVQHDRQSNQGWDLDKMLNDFRKWLNV